MKSTTGRKVTRAFSLAIVFLLALAWLGYSIPRQFIDFTERRQQSERIVKCLADFMSLMKDAETGQRGYILTGRNGYLEPFLVSRKRIEGQLVEIREITADRPEFQARLNELESVASRKLAELGLTVEMRRTDPAHGLERALLRINTDQGKALMDEVRRLAASLQDDEQQQSQQWTIASDQLARRMLFVSALFSPVAIALVIMTGWHILRDLKARSLMEQELRRLNDELEIRVEQRTAELVETNRILTQKNQEVETFVYSVSHDLRSPLVNLQGFSQEVTTVGQELRRLLDSDELPENVRKEGLLLLDDEMAESIRFIQSAVMRLSNIIDALLRLSRAGRVVYQPQMLDLNPVIQRIVEAQAAVITQKGATVRFDYLPAVWGDPTAIEQVFGNLVCNALNYLDRKRPGQIQIGVCVDEPETPSASRMNTYFVRDNGMGIPEDARHRMFHAFARLHPDASPGEGIGLTLVSRVIERHGGRIWFESTPGSGTTFFVSLPRNQSSSSRLISSASREEVAV